MAASTIWCWDCEERESEWECFSCPTSNPPLRMCNDCSRRCKKLKHELHKVQQTKLVKEHISKLEKVASRVRVRRKELAELESETKKIYKILIDAQQNLLKKAGPNVKNLIQQNFKNFSIRSDMMIGTNDSSENKTPDNMEDVISAAQSGDVEELKFLKETGVNIFGSNKNNRNALHFAAAQGRIDIVQYLASFKYEFERLVNAKDVWEHTPIDEAKRSNYSSVVKLLKRKKTISQQFRSARSSNERESLESKRGFFTHNQFHALNDFLRKESIDIMVIGEVNSGKSTFINALLNVTDICPISDMACTSALTRIRYGEKRECRLSYYDWRAKTRGFKEEIPITEWMEIPDDNFLERIIACRKEDQGLGSFCFSFTGEGKEWMQQSEERRSSMSCSYSTAEFSGTLDAKEDVPSSLGPEIGRKKPKKYRRNSLSKLSFCSNTNVLESDAEDNECDTEETYNFEDSKATAKVLNSSSFGEFEYVVELTCSSTMLQNGLEILDSPGMNECEMFTEHVRAMIENVDGVIYIMDAGKGTITEKDKEALTLIRESMSKIKQPFDCAFVVNSVDLWQKPEKDTVETNLDIFYKQLRKFMLFAGRSARKITKFERFEKIFPEKRSDCEIFHGLSALEAYRRPTKTKRFLEFEKSFAAQLGERLKIRELKAVRALALSIKFCYGVFGAGESAGLMYHTVQMCKDVSIKMKKKVFPELRDKLKELKPKYKECVKRIFDECKGNWIAKSGKLNSTSRMDSVWRRKQIVGRRLMRNISSAFQHDKKFLHLVDKTRADLRQTTQNLLKEKVRDVIKKGHNCHHCHHKKDSRMVLYQALETICWESFDWHDVELFTAARSVVSELRYAGKKFWHKLYIGFKTDRDIMSYFLESKGFSKTQFVTALLKPFDDAITDAENDCTEVCKNWEQLSVLVKEFKQNECSLSQVQANLMRICAKTLETVKLSINTDQKEEENEKHTFDYNDNIKDLVKQCTETMDKLTDIMKEVNETKSWYRMSVKEPWGFVSAFEDLEKRNIRGEGDNEKIQNERAYVLAPLEFNYENKVLLGFTKFVKEKFEEHSGDRISFSRAEFVQNKYRENVFVDRLRQFMESFEKTDSNLWDDKLPFLSILKKNYLEKRDQEDNLHAFNILLMWRGVSENEYDRMKCNVHDILQCGLADYAQNNQGWFGRGVYSTSYSGYAAIDSMGLDGKNQPNSDGEYVLLLCAVAVGKVYIISRETDYNFTEEDGTNRETKWNMFDYRYPYGTGKIGKDLKKGYDAHYACLSTKMMSQVPPCTEANETNRDELVVASANQMLPICKVYFTKVGQGIYVD